MAKGQRKKKLNDQMNLLKKEFKDRFEKVSAYNLDTPENIRKAISLLEENIFYPPHKIISLDDCLSNQSEYKKVLPKNYNKVLKRLKNSLQNIYRDNTDVEQLALHEIPLFENTQIINWPKDGRTNQLSRLVIAIKHVAQINNTSGYLNIDNILNNIVQIWSLADLPFPSSQNSNPFFNFYWLLLSEAIKKYSEIEDFAFANLDLSGKKLEQLHFIQFKSLLKEKNVKSLKTKIESVPIKPANPPYQKIKHSSSEDLERIQNSFDVLDKAFHVNHDKRSLTRKVFSNYFETSQDLSSNPIPNVFVGKLFIGSGFAGMTLMSIDPSIPSMARSAFQHLKDYLDKPVKKGQQFFIDTLLVSEYETGHWTIAEHRAEQEYPLLEISGNANASDFTSKEQVLNRSKRINTRHLFYSNTINMALKDTPPPLLGIKVEKLEKRDNHLQDWIDDSSNYKFRIKATVTIKTVYSFYIYAQSMEVALGMGEGQNIALKNALYYESLRSSRDQFTNNISLNQVKELFSYYSTYNKHKGFTPITHCNSFNLSKQEKQSVSELKTRRIVIVGNGAGTATAYRIAVLGTDQLGYRLQSETGEILEDRQGISLNHNVKIFSRGTTNYKVLAQQATESYQYAKAKGVLHENYLLIGIRIEHDEIILRFHKKIGAKEIDKDTVLKVKVQGKNFDIETVEDNGKYYYLNLHEEKCDQLISGIGQDASKIRSLILNEIKEEELKIIRGHDGHFVGLETACQSIRLHGAMAANLSRQITEDLADSLRKSNLPRNGNDQNIMPCFLGKALSFFSSTGNRRLSFNVNNCFLQRGDLRKHPTEFHQFLVQAGLKEAEIKLFVNFLIEERTGDKTGAGVSFKNLITYINTNKLADRLGVVSSCTIVAKNDLPIAHDDKSLTFL